LAQLSIFRTLACNIFRGFDHLASLDGSVTPADAFMAVSGQSNSSVSSTLVADAMDLITPSGRIDPLPYLEARHRRTLTVPSLLFPDPPDGLSSFANIRREHRLEYARLVVRQLTASKVALVRRVTGGATIFPVGKKDSAKQREVWSGDRVSAAAADPPTPPHLASPSALPGLECTPDQVFSVSKRDARCWFDQLKLPPQLSSWFGRPPVKVSELMDAGGWSLAQVRAFFHGSGPLRPAGLLYPVSSFFPMGFSWSSWVAQSCMLAICHGAGLDISKVLSDSRPPPLRQEVAFAVATDDVMVFTKTTSRRAANIMHNLDKSFTRHDAVRHEAKDVHQSSDCTCIGVKVSGGRFLSPDAASVRKILGCVSHVCDMPAPRLLSPRQLAAIIGAMAWHCQLCRPSYSVFHTVYSFTKLLPEDELRPLPDSCVQELAELAVLLPVFEADLARQWHPEIIATDASPAYGFGLSVLGCTPDFARKVGHLGYSGDGYAELDVTSSDYVGPKKGTPHRLGVHMDSFTAKLSLPAKYKAHSGSLEATGVSIALRWLLRRPDVRSRRVAMLVDAQAVLGALRKGRTSAPTLRFEVRRVAAMAIAADWHVHYTYVPSGCNPADAPSRGVTSSGKPRPGSRVVKHTTKVTGADREYRDWKRAWRKMACVRAGLI